MVVFYHINYLLFLKVLQMCSYGEAVFQIITFASKKPVNQGSLKLPKQRMRVTYSISILPNNIAD